MNKIEYSEVSDPTKWGNDNMIQVGDVFTEEWLDRVRWLMSAFNEAQALLRAASVVLENHESHGGYNEYDVMEMRSKIAKFLAP